MNTLSVPTSFRRAARYAAPMLMLMIPLLAGAQAPAWQWAIRPGGTALDMVSDMAVDAAGNSYVVGIFLSPSIAFGGTTLTNSGGHDFFVAKHDAAGALVWARSAGSSAGADQALGVATDAAGNVYVTGTFNSPSLVLGGTTLTNAGGGATDFFLAKYNASGTVVWAVSAGGSVGEEGRRVAVDAAGNVYVTGLFNSPSLAFGGTTLTNNGSALSDVFVVKYSAAGVPVWARSAGGNAEDWGMDIAVDAAGNSHVTGWFLSPSITFGPSTLFNAGSHDAFVVKYDPSGAVLWLGGAAGSGSDQGQSIALDAAGNVFVAGAVGSGGFTLGGTTLTSGGLEDPFLAKFGPAGNILWAKNAGGTGSDNAYAVTVDAAGNSYITGRFRSPTLAFGGIPLSHNGTGSDWDVFVAKYDPSGSATWARGAGGTGAAIGDEGLAIGVDAAQDVYVAGDVTSTSIAFDTHTLTGGSTTGDMFIAKLHVPGSCVSGQMAWSPVGAGTNGEVWALASSGTDLYAGGVFTTAGGATANHVAKWNGSAWSALGAGVNGNVYAVAVSGNDVYVGGNFTTAGSVNARNIAKWDGSSWSALGTGVGGLGGPVEALAVLGTDLYVGGVFNDAGGNSASHIARWNGSTWFPVGTGTDGRVNSLRVLGSDLYAGGQFNTAGGLNANHIAKWNGSAWSTLGTGMDFRVGGSLGVLGTDLYAGGSFTTAGGAAALHVAKWNGSAWSPLGGGTSDGPEGFATLGSDLYASGSFFSAGGVSVSHVAKWNGTAWSALGSGMNDGVWRLEVMGSELYAGGIFTQASGQSAAHVAKWGCNTSTAVQGGTEGAATRLRLIPTSFGSLLLRYELDRAERVRISLFDAGGKEAAVLLDRAQPTGAHEVRFDGSRLPAGVYFLRMRAGSTSETRRLMLAR